MQIGMTNQRISNKDPCYKCDKRVIGCHSTCEDYKLWLEEKSAINRRVAEAHLREQYVDRYIAYSIGRKKKKAHK